MNIIDNNPYRVLGVFANSKKKDISNNKAQLKAFLQANRKLSFPMDLNDFLPPINRTLELVNNAESFLVLPKEAIKYAQFWFVCMTDHDKNAFEKIKMRDVRVAENIWKNNPCMSSLHNLSVLKMILGQKEEAVISYALPCIYNYHEEFCRAISDTNSVTQQELMENLIYSVRDNHFLIAKIIREISDPVCRSSVDRMIIDPLYDEIENSILLVQNQSSEQEEKVSTLLQLKEISEKNFNLIKRFIGKEDVRYTILLNKVATVLLDGSIEYYNNSVADDSVDKSLDICKYCESISSGPTKERCRKNLSILVDISSKRPTADTKREHEAIIQAIEDFQNEPDRPGKQLVFLEKCQPYVVSIKEKLGKDNLYYVNVSTKIVETALNSLISWVNSIINQNATSDAQKINLAYLFRNALAEAWNVTLHLDKFDVDGEYRKKRYEESRRSLYELIEKYEGFKNPIPNYIIRGCCCFIADPVYFLFTEEEYYKASRTESQCRIYLEKYPHGKYSKEVGARLKLFYEERDKNEFKSCRRKKDYKMYLNNHPEGKYRELAMQEVSRANTSTIGMALLIFALVVSIIYLFNSWWVDSSVFSITLVACLIACVSTLFSVKCCESIMLFFNKFISK